MKPAKEEVNLYSMLTKRAYAYLARYRVTEAKLRHHLERVLQRHGYPPHAGEAEIERLTQVLCRQGILNDEEFGKALITTYRARHYGFYKLAAKLRERELPKELIKQLLVELQEEEPLWEHKCLEGKIERWRGKRPYSAEQALRAGFSRETVAKVLGWWES